MSRGRAIAAKLALGATLAIGIDGCRGGAERVFDDELAVAGPGDGGGGEESEDGTGGTPAEPLGPSTIGGTVVGLAGSGLVLQNNGGDDLEIGGSGAFSFPTLLQPDAGYAVTVRSQPMNPTQTCAVTAGSGTARGANVGDVVVTCRTNAYPIGGTAVGLVGSGLVLQNNDGGDLPVIKDGNFTFTEPVASGANFKVTIKTQPSGPTQTCSVSGATGTMVAGGVDSVVVNCGTNTYTIGGSVSGLAGTLVVSNGGKDRTITANGSYAFAVPLASGAGYNVTVKSQPAYPPAAQTCTVTNPTGTVGSANVTNVNLACQTNRYSVGGTITGLGGKTVVLRNNTEDKTISADGAFSFATKVASGSPYSVTVKTQPQGRTCFVSNGADTMTTSAVSSVAIRCLPSENFDSVTAPAIPSGWASTVVVGQAADNTWATSTANVESAPNAAFIPDYAHQTNIVLDSPSIPITKSTATLSFWTRWATELHNDGGVLEISINGAAFKDILDAGGTFASGGYNDTINWFLSSSTIAGRKAWSGTGVASVKVNLPAAAAGTNVVFRWRMGTNGGTGGTGWFIDSVVIDN